MKFALICVLCVMALACFPSDALADCGAGARGGAALAPVRAARAVFVRVRERERKPLRSAGRWLLRKT